METLGGRVQNGLQGMVESSWTELQLAGGRKQRAKELRQAGTGSSRCRPSSQAAWVPPPSTSRLCGHGKSPDFSMTVCSELSATCG